MNNLRVIKRKRTGRDNSGKVVVRHQGGEHKRFFRVIDFKRSKRNIDGKVMSIEYDPNRSCDIALIKYSDGDRRYILSPVGLEIGQVVSAGSGVSQSLGNAMPMKNIPVGTFIHNVELNRGRGGQLARGAGTYAILAAKESNMAHLKLPSGEIRKVTVTNYATIGQLSNVDWKNRVIGSAGRKRRMGVRPTVRGTAQNPRSHPHGGGEGRSGIGLKSPKTVYGTKAVGKTRKPKKYSNKYIISDRKKKK